MSVYEFRKALHNVIKQCGLFSVGKRESFSYVVGYLMGVWECAFYAVNKFSWSDYVQFELEYKYIWQHFQKWFENGDDIRVEITRIGWDDLKMENEWWYEHGES